MIAFNLDTMKSIASNVVLADNVFTRLKGLLGRDTLFPEEALWLKPCKGIHTIGMKFPIDVLFLDKDNVVIGIEENMPPYRVSSVVLRAASTVELPAGTVASTETKAGDRIVFSDGPAKE